MSEILLTFLAIALVVAVVFFFYISFFASKKTTIDKVFYQNQWVIIGRMLESENQAELHHAIYEADKLLDRALKERGLKGTTLGERLKSARSRLSDNNAVWQAHKLRNKIAHETGVILRRGDVVSALNGFKSGLKDLGAL